MVLKWAPCSSSVTWMLNCCCLTLCCAQNRDVAWSLLEFYIVLPTVMNRCICWYSHDLRPVLFISGWLILRLWFTLCDQTTGWPNSCFSSMLLYNLFILCVTTFRVAPALTHHNGSLEHGWFRNWAAQFQSALILGITTLSTWISELSKFLPCYDTLIIMLERPLQSVCLDIAVGWTVSLHF